MFDPTITFVMQLGISGLLGFAISQRLGYGLGFGLMMFVPVLNLIGFVMMAATRSPNERELYRLRVSGGHLGVQAAEAANRDYFRQLTDAHQSGTLFPEIPDAAERVS